MTVEQAVSMVSLSEELEAREAAARVRVQELESQIVELTVRLEVEREAWSRLRVTRETVAEVIAEMSGSDGASVAEQPVEPAAGGQPVRVVGAIMVPHWREGLSVDALPDVYRDIVEVVADASTPMQAKHIVPRIGLPAVTAKIEGTRGKLKRLVERGWLREDQPGDVRAGPPAMVESGEEGRTIRALLSTFVGANQDIVQKEERDGTLRRLRCHR